MWPAVSASLEGKRREPKGTVSKTPAAKRARKDPDTRRAEIVKAARTVFTEHGYAGSGFAEVASAAHVSKGLVYHYFPDGRSQLFVSVLEDVVGQFRDQLRQATKLPFSPKVRMQHLLGVIFGFFDENPDAYRLLFKDPWGAQDDHVENAATAIRVELASELAGLLADPRMSPDELVAASTGILGFALANVERCLAGQVSPEVAWRVTCDYAVVAISD